MRQKFAGSLTVLLCVWGFGCTTVRQAPGEEQRDTTVNARLMGQAALFGSELEKHSRRDELLELGIQNLARRLESSALGGVRVVELRAGVTEPVYVKDGGYWYFHVLALRGLKFENELAAAVAAAQVLSQLPQGFTGSWRSVNRDMIKLLYRNGYDPRGVVAFWRNWGNSLRQVEWNEADLVTWNVLSADLEEEARLEIAKLPPLLNPIVRSQEFLKIGKRLQKL